MAVGARIGKAEGRVGPRLCVNPAPCRVMVTTELVLLPNSEVEQHGEAPPPLCEGCPERGSGRVRHIEVRRDLRNRHGADAQVAVSGTTLPPAATEGGEREPGTPEATDAPVARDHRDDILPGAWGPDHPARLALEGREPERPRRRGYDGSTWIEPPYFGS